MPFVEGASINRPHLFNGVKYQFWKFWMKIFIDSFDRGIWDTIVNGPFVPKTIIDGVTTDKPWSEWSADESKKAQFDCMAKNIITSALNLDDFFRVL